MRHITSSAFALSCLLAVTSRVSAIELDTPDKRFSYTLGVQVGQQLKSQGVTVDTESFAAAVNDVIWGKELQLTTEQMIQAMQENKAARDREKQERGEAALEAGRKFLAENKGKPGVAELPSGLQYIELQAGEGESPKADSEVTVHYRGTLISGEEFDSSYGRGKPTSFKLDGVIAGFRESLTRMKPGAKWKVFMPSELAYGPSGAGSSIGPNETLIFEIELISVN